MVAKPSLQFGKNRSQLKKKKKALNPTLSYLLSPQKGSVNTILTGKLTLMLLEHQGGDFLICVSVRKCPKWPSL